ncbi:MAG: DNA-binding transcriptional regulator [Opitutales bacterium]|nr:DNA-binding transcriptional regulator [Opitutales bacterium]
MAQFKHVWMILGSYDQSAHEGIAQYAGQHGWHLNVSILKDFQLPEQWQGDGIITSLNNSRTLEEFVLNANVPTVDLSIWREDIDLPRVVADNEMIGKVGAEHFLEMGHQHCAWFALASNPVSRARYSAYSSCLADAGIECIRLDTIRSQDAIYIKQRLHELPKPCAIYTKSDYDAAWLSNLCIEEGIRVPEDVAILGADDNFLICENQADPISSVRHDLKTIGYEGAAMLDRLMNGETLKERIKLIPPRGITVRQSTDALAVTDPLIRQVLEHLQSEYRRSIGTSEIAEKFNLSRRSLETRFRASLHSSIREHLIHLRLKEAKRLLSYSDEPIETIAALTGFCHAPHFSNTFKKQVGMPPLKFRTSTRS